ncbi:uncharacterized protein LOC125291722 [Alosa alosa]|uniref:uncharacterized protein LOC125291722 n=1 Tax=Alosa alosa TaxID=278164 RepID=UPI0020154C58|nr:uncharacterized protein LOC125291722 [Alosa alosa]
MCVFLLPASPPDVDTLEVQYTVHHGPGGNLQFQQTTLFNGHVIFTCSSPTLRDQPQQHWVTNAFTQEGLEERHEQCKHQRYEHFASFEKIKQTITVSAVPILKMHLPARPSDDAHAGMELHIFGKHIPGGTVSYLQCLVADYSLSGVSSQLTKDGVPLDHGVYQTGPRPNGDGTVQMRVQVKTTMDNSKTYRCEVHSETFNKSVIFDSPEDGTLSQKSQEEKKKVKYKTDGSSSSESTQRLNASTSEGKNKRVTALTKFPVEMAT